MTDTSGAVIPGAAVQVMNEGTNAKRQVQTDKTGAYVFAELPVGYYTIKAEAQTFAAVVHRNVKVDVGADTRLDVSLGARGTEQAVTVTAEVPPIQRDSSILAEVVSTRQAEELPINGRDFRRLAFLTPGALPRTPRGSFGSFSVNGQREKSNLFLIDGVDNNDAFRGQPSFNQGGVLGGRASHVVSGGRA